MTSSIGIALVASVLAYALFGTFNAQAGGRIDPALSSTVFNGVAAVLSLVVVLLQKYAAHSTTIPTRVSGVVYSLLAGVAVGAFSILLINIYQRGGQLSYVFPVVYGGAIALTAVIGWLLLSNAVSPLRLTAVAIIAAGIVLLSQS